MVARGEQLDLTSPIVFDISGLYMYIHKFLSFMNKTYLNNPSSITSIIYKIQHVQNKNP